MQRGLSEHRTATRIGSPIVREGDVTSRTLCKGRKAMRHPVLSG
jgi:hypothetical protein